MNIGKKIQRIVKVSGNGQNVTKSVVMGIVLDMEHLTLPRRLHLKVNVNLKMVNRKRKNVQLQNAPQRIVLEIGCGILNVLGIVVMKMLS